MRYESKLSKERADKIGESLIEVLGLRVKKNGRVNTTWGDKSPEGLARTVERILAWDNMPKEN